VDAVAERQVRLRRSGDVEFVRARDRALVAVTILFALTAVPAFVLTQLGRAPRIALALALALPGVLALLDVVAIVAFL
jgi:hypothetical protein